MSLLPAYGSDEGATFTGPNSNNYHRSNLMSAVFGTKRWQICIYYGPDLYVVMAKRVLPDGEWTCFKYDGTGGLPSLQLADWDESHFNTSCAIDSNGYVHMQWNGNREWNDIDLQYRRSTVTIDQWAGELTANLAMTGYAGEGNLNYPTFFFDPIGNLYFTYRDGVSYSADQILNRYDTSTETWTGVGAANGKIIQGKTNDSVYMGIVPCFSADWDGAGTGRMWMVWTWRYENVTEGFFDICAMYWTGTGTTWKKPDGTAQTIPATVANATVIHEADYRQQEKWVQTTSRDADCSANGVDLMLTCNIDEYVGETRVRTPYLFLVSSGVVTSTTYDRQSVRHFWDEKDEKFKSYDLSNGIVSTQEQTTGLGKTARVELGSFFGDGVSTTADGAFFLDRQLLKNTGRLQALKIPVSAQSVTPEVVEMGSILNKPLPQMDFGGNTFTPSLRYNGGAATLATFRSR